MTSRQVDLSVNNVSIELNYFAQGFIDHTIGGMVAALEGVGEADAIDISIEEDKVTVDVNNTSVPINEFVTNIIRNTIIGMVSSFKGVSKIDEVHIGIRK